MDSVVWLTDFGNHSDWSLQNSRQSDQLAETLSQVPSGSGQRWPVQRELLRKFEMLEHTTWLWHPTPELKALMIFHVSNMCRYRMLCFDTVWMWFTVVIIWILMVRFIGRCRKSKITRLFMLFIRREEVQVHFLSCYGHTSVILVRFPSLFVKTQAASMEYFSMDNIIQDAAQVRLRCSTLVHFLRRIGRVVL